MGDFIFNDVIRSSAGEYFLRTANNIYQHRIVSSFFRNGALLDSYYQEYPQNISEEALLASTRSFHEEKKSEVQGLLELAMKLKDSDQSETKNLLGLAFLRKGMNEEAINEFEEAIVLSPKNSVIYNNLGKAYIGVGKYDEAIGVLEQAIELSPEFADLHHNLGIAYLKMNYCKRAVERFEQAIAINKYYAEAYYYLGLTYVQNAITREDFELSVNCYSKVLDSMEKAAKINPNFKNDHFQRGEEHLRDKDYQRAFDEFEKGNPNLSKPTDMAFILDFYLHVMYNGKQLKSATIWRHIRRLEELLKKYPNYADLYNHLGVAYVIMSKFVNNKAIQQFNKSIQINPTFERAKKNKRLAEYDHKGIQLLFDAILK